MPPASWQPIQQTGRASSSDERQRRRRHQVKHSLRQDHWPRHVWPQRVCPRHQRHRHRRHRHHQQKRRVRHRPRRLCRWQCRPSHCQPSHCQPSHCQPSHCRSSHRNQQPSQTLRPHPATRLRPATNHRLSLCLPRIFAKIYRSPLSSRRYPARQGQRRLLGPPSTQRRTTGESTVRHPDHQRTLRPLRSERRFRVNLNRPLPLHTQSADSQATHLATRSPRDWGQQLPQRGVRRNRRAPQFKPRRRQKLRCLLKAARPVPPPLCLFCRRPRRRKYRSRLAHRGNVPSMNHVHSATLRPSRGRVCRGVAAPPAPMPAPLPAPLAKHRRAMASRPATGRSRHQSLPFCRDRRQRSPHLYSQGPIPCRPPRVPLRLAHRPSKLSTRSNRQRSLMRRV